MKSVKRNAPPGLAAAFHKRFDRIFSLRTGYDDFDKLLTRLSRRKDELLKVLERSDISLHTNASENDLRSFVTKRKISGGPMSRHGRVAGHHPRLMKTCRRSACRSGTISAIGSGSRASPSHRWPLWSRQRLEHGSRFADKPAETALARRYCLGSASMPLTCLRDAARLVQFRSPIPPCWAIQSVCASVPA
ncbi:transposase [Ensifer adhaerens]|uniref:IS66 family transposase n=1 Tax=Ensifer adhaerens TaxID=106592 RepID=UPI00384DAD6C